MRFDLRSVSCLLMCSGTRSVQGQTLVPTPAPVILNRPPKAKCKDTTVCKGASITVSDVDNGSFDRDGFIVSMVLSKSGPFNSLSSRRVTLTVTDDDGATDKCRATVLVRDCNPPTAPIPPPTPTPTRSPTQGPTSDPTQGPTSSPTPGPTLSPTQGPTSSPTQGPTTAPLPTPTPFPNIPPKAKCRDKTVCKGDSIAVTDVDNGSFDRDGTIVSMVLSKTGPFNTLNNKRVTLTVTDNDGAIDKCRATVLVRNCVSPTAPIAPRTATPVTPSTLSPTRTPLSTPLLAP